MAFRGGRGSPRGRRNLQKHEKSPARLPKCARRRSNPARQARPTPARSRLHGQPETAWSWFQNSPAVLPTDLPPDQSFAVFSNVRIEGALHRPARSRTVRKFPWNETHLDRGGGRRV